MSTMSLISKSNVPEPARISNPLFAELTWRTDVLFTQQGLNTAKERVPVLKNFIAAVTCWEKGEIPATSRAKQLSHQAVLKHLRSPYVNSSPRAHKDAFYSALFCYLLIDRFCHHNHIGHIAASKDRTMVPFTTHLDYKHLKNWPALIKRTRDDLHAQTPRALYNSQDGNSACFRVLSEYTKSLNIAPVLHNFAAAVFNLSLLLEGNLGITKELLDVLYNEEDSSQPRIHYPPEKDRKRQASTKSLELPLTIALGISPICLLLPTALSEKSIAKEAIYKIWQGLGSKRPAALEKVECALLQVIVEATSHPDKLETSLRTALDFAVSDLDQLTLLDETKSWLQADPQVAVPHLVGAPAEEEEEEEEEEEQSRSTQENQKDQPPREEEEEEEEGASMQEKQKNQLPLEEEEEGVILQEKQNDQEEEDQADKEGPRTNKARQESDVSSTRAPVIAVDIDMGLTTVGDGGDPTQYQQEHNSGMMFGTPTLLHPISSGTSVHADPGDASNSIVGNAMEVDDTENERSKVAEINQESQAQDAIITSPSPLSSPSDEEFAMEIDTLSAVAKLPSVSQGQEPHVEGAALPFLRRSGRDRHSVSGGDQTKVVPTPSKSRKRRSKKQQTNDSQKSNSTGKQQHATVMEETADGSIRERILIDLTIEDIQADSVEPPTQSLKTDIICKRVKGPTLELRGPKVGIWPYNTSFHFPSDQKFVISIYCAVQSFYVDRMPRHLHPKSSELSVFRIMTYDEVLDMPTEALQETLRHKHIVMTEMGGQSYKFDEEGLRTVAVNLHQQITIHDHSIMENNKATNRHQIGTPLDLLKSHSDGEKGKILNALDFPMSYPHPENSPPPGLASDVAAFQATAGMQHCPTKESFPFSSTRWGLAATAGAHHKLHIDCSGFATYIHVKAGAKYWIVGRPKNGSSLDDTTLFTNDFSIDKVNADKFDYEAVYLPRDTGLIMMSGTIHAVLTPSASICHGGHFYAMSNMVNAVYGIVHTMVGSSHLTNTEHTTDSNMLLRRLVSHVYSCTVVEKFEPSVQHPTPKSPHVPKLNTVEGVKDLFSLLSLMELSDILNPFSYTALGLPLKDRVRMIHARKLSRIILRWFFCKYEICYGRGELIEDGEEFYYRCLGHQTKAILRYKMAAEECGMASDIKSCIAETMQTYINRVFKGNAAFWEAFNVSNSTSLSPIWFTFEVNVKQPPSVFNLTDCNEIDGVTPFDADMAETLAKLAERRQADVNNADDMDNGDDDDDDSDDSDDDDNNDDDYIESPGRTKKLKIG